MKSILITGGSGFFAQGLVKHLLDHNLCQRICIYSRGEFAQAQMRDKFKNDERLRFFIGDCRDIWRLTRAMAGCDLVVHAAALKRVEVGERDAEEMVKTNVTGAMHVIEAARAATLFPSIEDTSPSGMGNTAWTVRRVIFLSSDKACAPLNCYGATKLVAEKLFLAANQARGQGEPLFSLCRYGNIAGSTGSVIPTWWAMAKHQKATCEQLSVPNNCTVNLTNPDATRFWMSRQEAVDMVLWTAENMRGGEMVVPSLPAYRLGDLAEAMNLKANITGMGPGEKLHEHMISGYESQCFYRYQDYWVANGPGDKVIGTEQRKSAFSSHHARRMSVEELRQKLGEIE